ncbi:MAG: uroporphyrinogen-III C-methyltransferase [Planctomycetaceae bacterium]|nr:uroporphyrinogen-III C-methyltransferase [Planctomycetaceae bacterium]
MTNCTGKVYLVGAGPGDPGLISLKGLECLQQADFVLYDGLVNPLILRHTKAEAERTGRANEAGKRVLHQEQINERLVEQARLGKTVVRLKGGDPFIFGRGSEEAAALANAGIEFEVIPGITAATAAAEYAGFSLTHRDHASAVCLIAGHEDPTKPETALDYNVLAKFPGTLVFYMGLHRCQEIVNALMTAGMPSETMGAVITKASTPAQKVVTDRIDKLPQRVLEAGLHPPSLIIIGNCVNQREQIKWFENKPLFGLRIGITRPIDQAEPQIQRALQLGADPVPIPLIDIKIPEKNDELETAINNIDQYEWILFTSANGVHGLLKHIWRTGKDLRVLGNCKLACIGDATAQVLKEYQLNADLVPSEHRSEALAQELIKLQPTGKLLWPRASRGRSVLEEELKAASLTLHQVVAYEHHDVEQLPLQAAHWLKHGEMDWIGLSSPAIARAFARLIPEEARDYLGTSLKIAAISPVTAQAAQQAGLPVQVVAKQHTWEGIFQAILESNTKLN